MVNRSRVAGLARGATLGVDVVISLGDLIVIAIVSVWTVVVVVTWW